jgi:Mg/Co/Ni transporter MgtE
MARTQVDEMSTRTVSDVVHKRFSALPGDTTVAQVRDWFDASSHRKMAFLADDGRYIGSVTRDDIAGEHDPTHPARRVARPGPTIAPDAPAQAGYDLATATEALRVPVVDRDGTLIGVVAVTEDLAGFCGTS